MGLAVVDAGVVIGLLERADAHHDVATQALRDAVERGDRLALPASALAEVLVAPSRRGDNEIRVVIGLVQRVPLDVVPLDEPIAVAAAALRAKHAALKLHDALVVATASVLGADRLLTTDRGWPTARKLGLEAAIVRV